MWKWLKRWPVLLALLVAFGAMVVGIAYLRFGSRITGASCERIKKGMTYEEVCAILGEPWSDKLLDPDGPGDLDQMRAFWMQSEVESDIPGLGRYWTSHTNQFSCFWMGGNFGILVVFDQKGRVKIAEPCTEPDRPRTWLPARVWRRLRARYGW